MLWSEWSVHNLGSSNKWCYQHILLLPHCWPWWLIRCDNQWRNHQSMICKSCVTCSLRSENKLQSKQICMIEKNARYLFNIFNIHIDRGWVKYKNSFFQTIDGDKYKLKARVSLLLHICTQSCGNSNEFQFYSFQCYWGNQTRVVNLGEVLNPLKAYLHKLLLLYSHERGNIIIT